jgi:putative ABC transport system permease protein
MDGDGMSRAAIRRRLPPLHRPFVLLHFPATFGAIAAAAVILVAAAGAAPMFSSSTGTATLLLALGPATGDVLTVSEKKAYQADLVTFQDQQLREAATDVPVLADPTLTLVATGLSLHAQEGMTVPAVLASRTGFHNELELPDHELARRGVWLSASSAKELDVAGGEQASVSLGGQRTPAGIAGTYDDGSISKSDPFWAPLLATVPAPKEGRTSAVLVLASQPVFLRLATELESSGIYSWSFGLRPEAIEGLTLTRAQTIADAIGGLMTRMGDATVQLGSALKGPSVSTPLPAAVDSAVESERLIAPPIQTLALAGELAALAGLIGAGIYGVRRRRVEMRALDAIGIRWGRLAARGIAEAVTPMLLGAAIGGAATYLAVQHLGPSPVIDTEATRTALIVAVVSFGVAVSLLGVLTAVAARREVTLEAAWSRSRQRTSPIRWEFIALVLAAASLYEIDIRGTTPLPGQGGAVEVDRLLLLFPILFVAGLAGLAVRGLVRLAGKLRAAASSWPAPFFLASRRLSAAPRAASLLVVASSLAIGMLTYAGTAAATVRETTTNKVLVSVGADVVANTPGPIFPPPPDSSISTTNVLQLPFIHTVPELPDRVTIVGVDVQSFEAVASWNDSFSSRSLPDLLGALDEPSSTLPAVIVNGSLPAGVTLDMGGYQMPVQIVGEASAFPGEAAGPNLVVSTAALQAVLDEHGAGGTLRGASYRAFAHGPASVARAFLVSSGADPNSVIVAADRLNAPAFRALAWSLSFMELAGAVTGLVALIGLVLYLQAGQRSRYVAFAFTRRMGLSPGDHLTAIASELGGLLVTAVLMGAGLAYVALIFVYRRLDPLPSLPPAAVLGSPIALLAWLLLGSALISGVAAWLVHRWSVRVTVGTVLRYAE